METRVGLLALCSLLLAVVLPVCAQQPATAQPPTTIEMLLTEKTVPFTLKITEMSGEWRQFRISGINDDTSNLLIMMATEGRNPEALFPNYYSKGEIVSSAGESYLIVYQRKMKTPVVPPRSYSRHGGPEGYPPEGETADPELDALLTPDAEFTLALVNLKSAGHFSNIQAFNPAEELVASEKRRAEILKQREDARKVNEVGQLARLAQSVRRWARNHKGVLPPMPQMGTLIATLHESPTFYGANGRPAGKIADLYQVNTILSGKKLEYFGNGSGMVVFYQRTPSADGTRIVALLNGTARRIKEAEWPHLRQASKISAPAETPAP